MKTKVVLSGITATLALALTGCGEPTTLAEICKANMGNIKHFKGEVKVYKRINYDWKYNTETQKDELKEDGIKGYLIVDKDTKVDLEKFNVKADAFSMPKGSIPENTPHMYILKKYDDIGEGDKTEVLATLETLNPRCNVDGSLELKQKDTKIIAIK